MAAATVIVAPAALDAQQNAPNAAAAEVQGWAAELERVREQLGPIQERALQDGELHAEREALTELVEAAVLRNPDLADLPRQVAELEERMRAAQESGDRARMEALVPEVQLVQQRVARAHALAFQDPEIAPRVAAFQEKLQAKMIEVDPRAEALLERHDDLERRIAAALGPNQR